MLPLPCIYCLMCFVVNFDNLMGISFFLQTPISRLEKQARLHHLNQLQVTEFLQENVQSMRQYCLSFDTDICLFIIFQFCL